MSEFNIGFTHAYGKPTIIADFRTKPDDFIVTENLGFEPCGEGEHLYVQIKKIGENTNWVAEQLANHFKIRTMDVGLAGLKDRHAVTTQWFSLYLPKHEKAVDWSQFTVAADANVEILNWGWHKQKLRRGMHVANRFVITLRNLSSQDGLEPRLKTVEEQGVPNYFGEQRFGHSANNLVHAHKWFVENEVIRKNKLRGMVMSAARSYLFNQVLQARVEAGNWQQPIAGDVASESHATLQTEATGPLWGRGRALVTDATLELENAALSDYSLWTNGLEYCGLDQDRRSLRLMPNGFKWTLNDDSSLVLEFDLGSGQYATSVIRELLLLNNLA